MPVVLPADQEDYDGTLLPTDFKQAGQIRDTELARLMVHGLPAGVVLHALFDSCHSGQVTGAVECRPGIGSVPAHFSCRGHRTLCESDPLDTHRPSGHHTFVAQCCVVTVTVKVTVAWLGDHGRA